MILSESCKSMDGCKEGVYGCYWITSRMFFAWTDVSSLSKLMTRRTRDSSCWLLKEFIRSVRTGCTVCLSHLRRLLG